MGVKVPLELFLESVISAAGGPQQNQALAKELCGKVVAIDVTQWIFQALDGQRRAAFSGPNEVAKSVVALCISRVLDGVAPAAKDETRFARQGATYTGQSFGESAAFSHMKRAIQDIMLAAGLPCIMAPGEGEAMCAVLNALGLADAVATTDVCDAFMFGARRVLLNPKLDFIHPHLAQVSVLGIETLQGRFGLEAGGDEVLTAIGIIIGSDYNRGGLQGAGPEVVVEAMVLLVSRFAARTGRIDDVGFLAFLAVELAAPVDEAIASLVQCTGCKRCGHEGGNKALRKCHGKSTCAECAALGHEGAGCLERPGVRCSCRFHSTEPERKVERLKRLAQAVDPATAGAVPFHETLRTVVQHFLDERQRARSAAASLQRSDLLWNKAPDAVQLAKLLEGKGFVRVTKSGHDEILSKVASFHVEFAKRAGEASTAGSMYTLEAIKKVKPWYKAAQKGVTANPTAPSADAADWQYLMDLAPRQRSATTGSTEERELLKEWAKYDEAKALNDDSNRVVRVATVQQKWPRLEAAFLAAQSAKAAKGAKAAPRAAYVPPVPPAHQRTEVYSKDHSRRA